jgi:hypothetical protein
MTIEIFHEADILTVEDQDTQEDITIVAISSGQFEIEVTMKGGHIKNFLLSRAQMKDVSDWIKEALG